MSLSIPKFTHFQNIKLTKSINIICSRWVICAQMFSPRIALSVNNSVGVEGDKCFHSSQPGYESANSQG